MGIFWRYFRAVFLGILMSITVFVMVSCEQISGDSMNPLLEEGDVVLVSRLAYIAQEPSRGDIVAFRTPVYTSNDNGAVRFKRVVYVKDEKAFVLSGENAEGTDSRDDAVGMIPVKELEGRAFARIFPIYRARLL